MKTAVMWAPRFPLVGSLPYLRFSRSDFLLETSRRLGDTYWLDLGIDRVLVIGHPASAAQVLENHGGAFPDKGGNSGFRRISVPFLGGGLSTWNVTDGEWKRRRRAFARLYRHVRSRIDLDDLTDIDGTGLRLWIEREIIADMTARLLAVVPPLDEISQVTDLLRQLAGRFWSTKVPVLHFFVGTSVRQATRALELIVHRWLQISDRDSPIRRHAGYMTETQLRDEVLSQFLSVGTLAVPAVWALHLLATNPSVQCALRESLADSSDEYLTWTAMETLRLCPSTYWIQRRVCGNHDLSGTEVSEGDLILVHVPSVHRHPDFWVDPDSFRPERFGEDSSWKRAWMPFGRGPRLCVGHAYSLEVIKRVIARVVTSHLIAENTGCTTELVTGFSLRPRPCPSLVFTQV